MRKYTNKREVIYAINASKNDSYDFHRCKITETYMKYRKKY